MATQLMRNQPGPRITLAAVLAQQGRTAEATEQRKQPAALTQVGSIDSVPLLKSTHCDALLKKGSIADANNGISRRNQQQSRFFRSATGAGDCITAPRPKLWSCRGTDQGPTTGNKVTPRSLSSECVGWWLSCHL
jgi:hypothetical protein